MSVVLGSNPVTDGLVFSVDAANPNSVSRIGATKVANAKQLVNNLVSRSDITTSDSELKVEGLNYQTIVAIDYPESTNGGTFAARHGVTAGFYNLSSAKTYDSGRALHLWAWNNDTNAWVADSYFSGGALGGHCYDNYSGVGAPTTTAQLAAFVTDYNKITSAFPNCTFVSTGSHRCDTYSTEVLNILYSLGMPTGYLSAFVAAPEWILVGKPNLGVGNSYGWQYENNNAQSAAMVAGLGNFGTSANYFSFNGSSNYIGIAENSEMNTQTPSVEVWVKTNATTQSGFWFEKGTVNSQYALFQEGSVIQWRLGALGDLSTNTASYMNTSNWYQVVGTFTSGDRRLYINGVQVNSNTTTGTLGTTTAGASIGVYGGYNGSRGYWFNGNIAVVKVYNKALTPAEVKRNFEALRRRFGI